MKSAEDYIIEAWEASNDDLQMYVTLNPDIELFKKVINQAHHIKPNQRT